MHLLKMIANQFEQNIPSSLQAFWTIDDFGILFFVLPYFYLKKRKNTTLEAILLLYFVLFSRTFIANNHLADRFR